MAAPSEAELAAARAAGAGRAALGPLPDGYPTPRLRLVMRDVNVRFRQPPKPLCNVPVLPVLAFERMTLYCEVGLLLVMSSRAGKALSA